MNGVKTAQGEIEIAMIDHVGRLVEHRCEPSRRDHGEFAAELLRDARGDAFDPHCHQAVIQQPADGVAPGCVVQCFQSGYRLGDHILRSAKVVVSPSE